MQVKWWELIVKAPFFTTKKTIEGFIYKHSLWIEEKLEIHKNKKKLSDEDIKNLRKEAKKYIPDRVKFIANKYWLKYNKVRITSAKTRWWSCSSRKNLNFTYRLILTPIEVIDYVIVHELAHLKEMNHSKKFWLEVEKMMSDYKVHRKWLKKEWMNID